MAAIAQLPAPHQDAHEHAALLQRYTAEFAPTSAHEEFLVSQMVSSRWRLARLQRLESRLYSGYSSQPDPDGAILADFQTRNATTLQRAIAAAERSYYKAHKELATGRRAAQPRLEKAAPSQPGEFEDALEAFLSQPGGVRERYPADDPHRESLTRLHTRYTERIP